VGGEGVIGRAEELDAIQCEAVLWSMKGGMEGSARSISVTAFQSEVVIKDDV
jgi:hypothetical protein